MSFGRTVLTVCLANALLTSLPTYAASLTFVESTRLVFNASNPSVDFPIKNDTNLNYLVKANVRDVFNHSPGKVNPHFLVLPEVLKLEPGKHLMLRVLRVGGNFPKDRESVFFVTGHFIPESKRPKSGDSPLNLAVAINMKMFYRPETIIDLQAIKKVSPKLRFSLTRDLLMVNNPSPYWLTFGQLSCDKQEVTSEERRKMIPPFGGQSYRCGDYQKGKRIVKWSLIDEFGHNTEQEELKILAE